MCTFVLIKIPTHPASSSIPMSLIYLEVVLTQLCLFFPCNACFHQKTVAFGCIKANCVIYCVLNTLIMETCTLVRILEPKGNTERLCPLLATKTLDLLLHMIICGKLTYYKGQLPEVEDDCIS